LLPLTALVNGLRAIMLQGASLSAVLPQIAVLSVFFVISLAVALKVFRWQ
jgi:ABC-2 type transport system permease protein